ncbi:hypothetical protein AZI86_10875 [Bdellovibrio bacteriovorus]|uniref:Polymerase nucleotidyl transferase domain-containing protein n=1 Tax=Bdellovibrio bacteriovorus TaxID=959 RepID=A0A150WLC7_BDEBC|nr:nucleotidyltransferase domain-containing protein [Bdellovibrio bacteriovorus]KYG64706.1 hypothetical protein AZI86_10875 [Bdellovibrio bacteriovorus]
MVSGKFVLRLEPGLHQALKEEASRNGESLNQLCNRKLKSFKALDLDLPLEEIIKVFSPQGVVLFGSQVRGQATEKSDIDILVVLGPQVKMDREFYRRWDQLGVGEKYSPQFVALPKPGEPVGSLWLENAIEGEILYDLNGNVKKVFRDIRGDIAKGLYIKKMSHGQGYWIRQGENAK